MSENVYFGDVIIPWISDKDTSIERETVEKNFVDSPPQVYELTPSLEAGTYSAVHNETIHPRNESFAEQIDAAQSMPQRHVTEFPFEIAGDTGHVMVGSVTSSTTPSNEMRTSDMELRFLEDSVYQPAFVLEAESFNDTFDSSPIESVVALPDTVENVQDDDSNALTPVYSITGEDGTIDLYKYSTREIISYDRNSTDFASDERVNAVRLYRSDDQRIYSDSRTIDVSSTLENGKIRAVYADTQTNVSVYDTSWRQIGNINAGADDGYAPTNENYEVEVDFLNSFNSTIYKEHPVIQYDISGISSFTFMSNEDLTTQDTASSWYRVVSNVSGDDIILVRTSMDGSFNDDISTLEVNSLSTGTEYTFFIGIVPGGATYDEFARYVYNRGIQKRNLVQR